MAVGRIDDERGAHFAAHHQSADKVAGGHAHRIGGVETGVEGAGQCLAFCGRNHQRFPVRHALERRRPARGPDAVKVGLAVRRFWDLGMGGLQPT
jgi:hypothetical protein